MSLEFKTPPIRKKGSVQMIDIVPLFAGISYAEFRETKIEKKALSIILFYILFELHVNADLTSSNGNILFDIDNDQTIEMQASSLGLGVGVVPSANLHIKGNAIVTDMIRIGNNSPNTSTLNIGGSLGFGKTSYGAGSNLISDDVLVFADTSLGNVHLNLPSAAANQGKIIKIKRTSLLNNLYISGSGNLLDNYFTLEFSSGNLSMVELLSNGSQWFITGRLSDEVLAEVGYQGQYIWWKLDDTSGNVASGSDSASRSGNLLNEHSFSGNSVSGILDAALKIDDASDSLIYESTNLTATGYTYSLWINSTKSPTDFLDNDPVISGPAGFCWGSGNVTYSQAAYHQLSDESYVSAKINSTLSSNTWYHIAVSWNGSQLQAYLNGSLESGNTAGTWSGASNVILSHPGSFSSGNVCFDDIRYFERALDAEAIQALYQTGAF